MRTAAALLLLLLAAPALADDAALAAQIAAEHNVAQAEVMELVNRKMGWGEVGYGVAIAQKAGVPLRRVIDLRMTGLSWPEVCKKFGFTANDVEKRVSLIQQRGTGAYKTRAPRRSAPPARRRSRPPPKK
jgi:hypothetical protein